jgi:hypothetical protein
LLIEGRRGCSIISLAGLPCCWPLLQPCFHHDYLLYVCPCSPRRRRRVRSHLPPALALRCRTGPSLRLRRQQQQGQPWIRRVQHAGGPRLLVI